MSIGTNGARAGGVPDLVFVVGGSIVLIAIFIALAMFIRSNREPR